MSESTQLLQNIQTYSDARRASPYTHDGVRISSFTQNEASLILARELELRAKRYFDAAKHENIVTVDGLRPMTEAEYSEFKKFESE